MIRGYVSPHIYVNTDIHFLRLLMTDVSENPQSGSRRIQSQIGKSRPRLNQPPPLPPKG